MQAHLTDGQNDYQARTIKDVDELDELNRLAFEKTDGNLYWYALTGLPRVGSR